MEYESLRVEWAIIEAAWKHVAFFASEEGKATLEKRYRGEDGGYAAPFADKAWGAILRTVVQAFDGDDTSPLPGSASMLACQVTLTALGEVQTAQVTLHSARHLCFSCYSARSTGWLVTGGFLADPYLTVFDTPTPHGAAAFRLFIGLILPDVLFGQQVFDQYVRTAAHSTVLLKESTRDFVSLSLSYR